MGTLNFIYFWTDLVDKYVSVLEKRRERICSIRVKRLMEVENDNELSIFFLFLFSFFSVETSNLIYYIIRISTRIYFGCCCCKYTREEEIGL